MKNFGIALLLFGFIGTIGYTLYVLQFSGSGIGVYPVQQGGSIQVGSIAVGQSSGRAPVGPIRLDSSMNPIRVKLKVNYSNVSRMGTSGLYDYQVEMVGANTGVVWTKGGTVRSSSKKKKSTSSISVGTKYSTVSVKTFDVDTVDEYTFLASVKSTRASIGGVELELRRNVETLNMSIVIAGGLITLLGIALTLIGRKLSS